jgi:hypothetical protein
MELKMKRTQYKYAIGDDVWIMSNNNPRKMTITKVTIEINSKYRCISYRGILNDNCGNGYGGERNCYLTKKELLDSL